MIKIIDYFIIILLRIFENLSLFPGIKNKFSRAVTLLSMFILLNLVSIFRILGVREGKKMNVFIMVIICLIVLSVMFLNQRSRERIKHKVAELSDKDYYRGNILFGIYVCFSIFLFILTSKANV